MIQIFRVATHVLPGASAWGNYGTFTLRTILLWINEMARQGAFWRLLRRLRTLRFHSDNALLTLSWADPT
jgi:hypothetical protein